MAELGQGEEIAYSITQSLNHSPSLFDARGNISMLNLSNFLEAMPKIFTMLFTTVPL